MEILYSLFVVIFTKIDRRILSLFVVKAENIRKSN